MTDPYLATVARLEPDTHPIDGGGAYASIAISLKRIADVADRLAKLADILEPLVAEAIAEAKAEHRK